MTDRDVEGFWRNGRYMCTAHNKSWCKVCSQIPSESPSNAIDGDRGCASEDRILIIEDSDPMDGPDDPPPVAYDLSAWSDDQRQALVTELVEKAISHGWSGATLNVSQDAQVTVDAITSQVALEPSPPEATAPVTATTDIEPSDGQHPMSERLRLLERLIAVRDAGGLTPEEFETARAKAARELVQDDE